jgi:hypothetical protein
MREMMSAEARRPDDDELELLGRPLGTVRRSVWPDLSCYATTSEAAPHEGVQPCTVQLQRIAVSAAGAARCERETQHLHAAMCLTAAARSVCCTFPARPSLRLALSLLRFGAAAAFARGALALRERSASWQHAASLLQLRLPELSPSSTPAAHLSCATSGWRGLAWKLPTRVHWPAERLSLCLRLRLRATLSAACALCPHRIA